MELYTQGAIAGKLLSPVKKRRAFEIIREKFKNISERKICKVIELARSTKRYKLLVKDDESILTSEIIKLAKQYGRYGYRRITEFHKWAVEQLRQENEKEVEQRQQVIESQRKAYDACLSSIDRLVDMRIRGAITQEVFETKKASLVSEKEKYQELLKDADINVNKWLDVTEQIFDFAETAKDKFENGTLEDKRQILSCLGSNLVLSVEGRAILSPKIQFQFGVAGGTTLEHVLYPAIITHSRNAGYSFFLGST